MELNDPNSKGYPIIFIGVQLIFYIYYISPIEIGLLWSKIKYVKSHSTDFDFWLYTDM